MLNISLNREEYVNNVPGEKVEENKDCRMWTSQARLEAPRFESNYLILCLLECT